jgi:hypothetical protein
VTRGFLADFYEFVEPGSIWADEITDRHHAAVHRVFQRVAQNQARSALTPHS